MITLNVNIDHVATLRNARGGNEPDPVTAAVLAEHAGATGIVCHLREDRRHIKDRDLFALKEANQTKLDLEMACTDEIIEIARKIQPDLVTIVPERRAELTTEGGLDIVSNFDRMKKLCDQMHEKDIEVSFFVEPSEEQIEAALKAGAEMVELHTGHYANARGKERVTFEFNKIVSGASYANEIGLQVAAGHGLNYVNTQRMCFINEICELSIGHSIMARAIIVGIDRAVRDMLDLINNSTLHRNIDI